MSPSTTATATRRTRRCGGKPVARVANTARDPPAAPCYSAGMSDDTPDFDAAAVRAELMRRRAELADLDETSRESRGTVTLDQQSVGRLSRVDALQGQAMAQAAGRRRAAEIQRIDAALARLESGDYGYCAVCDEPIAPRRLAADPATPTCVACAAGTSGA